MPKVKETVATYSVNTRAKPKMRSAKQRRKFIFDDKGNRVGVILDLSTYEALIEAQEELEDIRDYDEAKPKVEGELRAGKFVTLTEYMKMRRARRA